MHEAILVVEQTQQPETSGIAHPSDEMPCSSPIAHTNRRLGRQVGNEAASRVVADVPTSTTRTFQRRQPWLQASSPCGGGSHRLTCSSASNRSALARACACGFKARVAGEFGKRQGRQALAIFHKSNFSGCHLGFLSLALACVAEIAERVCFSSWISSGTRLSCCESNAAAARRPST